MLKRFILLGLMALFLLAAAACGGVNVPQPIQPTLDIAAVAAQTLTAVAGQQAAQPTSAPEQGITPEPATSTAPESTATQEATATSTPLPSATSTPTVDVICANKAKLASETIQDGTKVDAGTTFEKTWTLQNTGTCTWTAQYSVKFVEGNQMNGASPEPLAQEVKPNDTVVIKVQMKAPAKKGDYVGHWRLVDAQGNEFAKFYVEIVVPEDESGSGGGLDLGQADSVDNFDEDNSYWMLGKDANSDFEIEGGNLVMTGLKAKGDQWRVAPAYDLEDFYVEIKATTGDTCAGKDSYGMIVRTNESSKGVFDSGYVFGISCDGAYRVYLMDKGTYSSMTDWTMSSAIVKGPKGTNTIGVYGKGDDLRLYVNGKKVYEFTDDTFSSGKLGLFVRMAATQGFQVFIDTLSYWGL